MKDALVRLVRRRYIAFKLNRPPLPSRGELLTMLMASIEAVGREGSEQYHIRVIDYDLNTGRGIVRCDHRAVSLLLSVLRDSAKNLGRYDTKTIGISGSIKTLKRKFL